MSDKKKNDSLRGTQKIANRPDVAKSETPPPVLSDEPGAPAGSMPTDGTNGLRSPFGLRPVTPVGAAREGAGLPRMPTGPRLSSTWEMLSKSAQEHLLLNSRQKKIHPLDAGGVSEIQRLVRAGKYELQGRIAAGAECLLYRAKGGEHEFCVKAIRNVLDKVVGNPKTRHNEEKLTKASYSTKVRHLKNEFMIGQEMFSMAANSMPVRIMELRKVKALGLIELGYDMAMELIDGSDLSDKTLLRALTLEDKLYIVCDVLKAVNQLHHRGYVHLDIKPSNFMLTNTGEVRMIDFGITVSKGTRGKGISGTVGYLSPEQICKDVLVESTDIFALGVTFSVIFGGRILSQNMDEIKQKSTRKEAKYSLTYGSVPAVAEIPELNNYPALAEIIRSCTILQRDRRPQNCGAVITVLRSTAQQYGHQTLTDGARSTRVALEQQ